MLVASLDRAWYSSDDDLSKQYPDDICFHLEERIGKYSFQSPEYDNNRGGRRRSK